MLCTFVCKRPCVWVNADVMCILCSLSFISTFFVINILNIAILLALNLFIIKGHGAELNIVSCTCSFWKYPFHPMHQKQETFEAERSVELCKFLIVKILETPFRHYSEESITQIILGFPKRIVDLNDIFGPRHHSN